MNFCQMTITSKNFQRRFSIVHQTTIDNRQVFIFHFTTFEHFLKQKQKFSFRFSSFSWSLSNRFIIDSFDRDVNRFLRESIFIDGKLLESRAEFRNRIDSIFSRNQRDRTTLRNVSKSNSRFSTRWKRIFFTFIYDFDTNKFVERIFSKDFLWFRSLNFSSKYFLRWKSNLDQMPIRFGSSIFTIRST